MPRMGQVSPQLTAGFPAIHPITGVAARMSRAIWMASSRPDSPQHSRNQGFSRRRERYPRYIRAAPNRGSRYWR